MNRDTAAVSSSAEMEDNDENPELCAKEKLILKTFVQEYKFLHRLVDGIVKNGGIVDLAAVKKAQSILDKYQEQGQLLEPHLESLVSPLMNLVRSKTVDLGIGCESERVVVKIIQPICMFLYTLVTVCGYKIVARFFPHQVSDLEPAVMLLEKCHARTSVASSHIRQESTGEWETKCIILLWLSILVLVPFDISSVDTAMAGNVSADDGVATSPLVERMISICKDFLSNPGPMRKMAGVLLSKLLTRPDMKHNLTRFMEWTENSLAASGDGFANNFLVAGITEATAAIFKAGGRDTLLDVVSIAWKETCTLLKSTFAAHSPLICKLLIKLTQRIGLTYLPQRLPTWRYVGKSSFLKENLSSQVPTRNSDNGATQELKSPCALKIEDSQDTEMEVPSVIEEIIEQLLSGLRDKDTVVRWSAAKGIGRVTSCLTTGFADDVISSILDLFSPGEGDGSWHGGCLALAELARRGLLLPNRLPDVVPVIIKALHYDVRRGPHSVGSHVRDAASYVCWAFGRAYSHPVMKSVLNDIAPHLLAVACYDREVNCRRAAAAAVQENVGRQGAFPHGIDIINAADYFTLASRNNSYQHVAVHIARFNNYLPVFIEELVERKINHWDKVIKELAAISLASLVKYDVIYFGDTVLSKLIPCTLSLDLNMRHGATLAVAEVVLALHQNGYVFTTENSRAVGGIVPAIEKARLYRGKGGEIMRASVSKLIECTSIAHIHLSAKVQNKLLETINENLRHPNAQIQACAARALCQFVRAYVDSRDMVTVNGFSSKYVQILRTDPNVAAKRGAALALSVLPYQFLIEDWKSILEGLSDACVVPENPNERDAETRVNAVRGLLAVCQTLTGVGMESNTPITYRKEPLLGFIKKNVIHMLFKALDDYSVDNRGDVGSWVREAAMEALEKCTDILCQGFYMFAEDASIIANLSYTNKHFLDCVEKEEDIFDQELAAKVTALIAKQAVEKIDKVRDVAGKTLQRIIHNNNVVIPFIPHRDQLERIVPKERTMNWAVPSVSFPRLVKLLQYEEYRMPLLSGLVVSTGGLSESLSKASLSALIDFLHVPKSKVDIHKKRVKVLASTLTEVLHRYQKVNRVIIPSIKTIELLFDKGVFMQLEEEQKEMFSIAILESLAVELKGSKDVTKLITGINVLESVSALKASNRNKIFSFLLSFLGHPYPKVRKSCADRVYLYLIQNGELFGTEVLNKALELIGETCWDGIREEAITQMKEIYRTFNLEAPSVRTVPQRSDKVLSESKFNKKDENESYSALVDSSGF